MKSCSSSWQCSLQLGVPPVPSDLACKAGVIDLCQYCVNGELPFVVLLQMFPLGCSDMTGKPNSLAHLYSQWPYFLTFSQCTKHVSVVGRIFDEGRENYSLLVSWGEVVVLAGPAVSWIFDIDGVKEKGVGDIGNVPNRGTWRLILLVITTSISTIVINLTIFIVVLLDDRYRTAC